MYPPVLSTQTIGGKDSFPVQAKAKVWADADNNLVADGDEKAAILVAKEGESLSLHEVQKYPNYRDHFEPINGKNEFPPTDDAEEKEIQEAAAPKRGPGRPPKAAVVSPLV